MSGKRSKLLRKKSRFSKKTLAMGVGLCIGSAPVVADSDFIVSLYPHFTKPFGTTHSIEMGVGGGLKLNWRPTDYLNLFAYGDYLSLSLPNVDSITLMDGGVGTGYHFGITDHFAMDLNLFAGAYTAKAAKRLSGLTGGVSLTFTYRISPVASVDVHASGSHFASGSSPLMTVNAGISPGLSINFTELFSNKTKVNMDEQALVPVFPVLYSWYENNSFGKVKVTNNEESSITDVKVSFYQPQYMGHPKECAKFKKLEKSESVDVDLYAFFNEQMLELTEKTDTQALIIVEYSCLGQKRSRSFSMIVPVYGRNNMSWDDDRRAAVFVSSKDPAAMLFAKYITSVVRDNVRSGVPGNIQYAMGIFEALDEFGLSYVIDPTSAFEDNVGTSSIDFLQFPYQTLMYRGGDCDDLSILVCSLFEAVGIRTAFITVPGHIYMAFDSGLTLAQAKREFTNLDEMIVDGDEVWIPLEITLSDEGFYKAWRVGAREWNTAQRAGTAALYKMEDSWKTYAPVSVPGANAFFTMPDRAIVAKLFDHSVDQWITKQIEPQIQMYEAKLAVKDDVKTRNKLGILYGKYGLFVQADEQFKQARRQGYTPSVLNTGNVYFSMKDYERASRWYKSVLKKDSENELALIGVARCAYELTNYEECDAAFGKVRKLNPELAEEYAYLGTFVSSKGRAFSLADRLENTIWSEEPEEVPQKLIEAVESATKENEPVIKDEPFTDTDLNDLFAFDIEAFIAPVQTQSEEDEEDLEDHDIATAGGDDGDDDDSPELDPTPVVPEPVEEVDITSFTENFTGLVSEVALDVNDFIYEDVEDDVQVSTTSDTSTSSETLLAEPAPELAESTLLTPEPVVGSEPVVAPELPDSTSVIAQSEVAQATEIIPVAVPRFTEQPSAEWAPEEAYIAETIPGMKSFEEEMGAYQNEKAFLYEDKAILEVDPENDVDEPEVKAEKEQYASAGIPDINPFSSYLSKEDEKAVVLPEPVVVPEQTSVAEPEPTPVVPEPVPAPSVVETAQPAAETAQPAVEVASPAVEIAPEAAEPKTKKGLLALASAVLAAGAIIFKNKKNKKEESKHE